MRVTALLAGLVVPLGAASAQPMDRDINPGILGPNALPTLPSESPKVGDELILQLGWSGQLSTPLEEAADLSMLVPIRVEVPLLRRVAFAGDGSPFELWRYSARTNDAWAPRRSQGITRADVRLWTKVLLFDESGPRPATAVRAMLKTATGEDLFTRRFLDAPAYQFDALAGWHLLAGGTRLEAWLSVGFLAWQQGFIGQNDALTYSATAVARGPLLAGRLEVRGYVGWQKFDAPVTLEARAELTLTSTLHLLLHLARTFRDPPSIDVGLALRVLIPMS